ncbi:MAG: glutamate-5-semialdehyde dehydrogenase [Pirellulales bacterium]
MAGELAAYCLDVAWRARTASRLLVRVDSGAKDAWLRRSAVLMGERAADVVAANAKDLAAAAGFGLTDAGVDRLRLDAKGVTAIALALDEIAAQGDPVGEVIESSVRPNGLEVRKVRVPLGVVFFIYESRPNVTADAAALCVKSGNAVILRGGKEAAHSSRAIVDVLAAAARECGVPEDAVQLVSTADRDAVGHFLALAEYIDLAIPRGGEGLIRRVVAEAKMPVLKHFDGNCHVYVDRAADVDMAVRVLVNAKCQRLGVCNAAESLLVHADVAEAFLPQAAAALVERGIEIRGDERTRRLVPTAIAATDEDYRTEFLGPILSCKVVDSIDEAIAHINRYGSKHTDAILSNDATAAHKFAQEVDTAAVMVNASTRFNDGGQLGLGAEIGISTDKFHARGPCGARELTTYKWIVSGTGQTRE